MEDAQMTYPAIIAEVRRVLKKEARNGQTTMKGATALAARKIIEKPGSYGIGQAAIRMAVYHIVGSVVRTELKSPVSEHAAEFVFKPAASPELKKILAEQSIPQWLAIEEGEDALWKHFRTATASDWEANFLLKQKKAVQTMMASTKVRELIDIMRTFGINNLGEVFQ
jgi:hypothetical protein